MVASKLCCTEDGRRPPEVRFSGTTSNRPMRCFIGRSLSRLFSILLHPKGIAVSDLGKPIIEAVK
jgi:hypothetical protein